MKKTIFIISLALAVAFVLVPLRCRASPAEAAMVTVWGPAMAWARE